LYHHQSSSASFDEKFLTSSLWIIVAVLFDGPLDSVGYMIVMTEVSDPQDDPIPKT